MLPPLLALPGGWWLIVSGNGSNELFQLLLLVCFSVGFLRSLLRSSALPFLETSNLAPESRFRKKSAIGGVFSGDLIQWGELLTLRGEFRK